MKIDRVRVSSYGRIADLDTGGSPLPGLVVVTGDNEAGKSTLFHCLSTALFGFAPAKRELHPYAPWTAAPGNTPLRGAQPPTPAPNDRRAGGDLRLEVDYSLDSGETLLVRRTLTGRPTGQLEHGSFVDELGNRQLPTVLRVGRRVFETIYAVSLDRLRQLDAESWERVLELLLTGLGADDLGSLRAAIQSLEQEANARWRPDRRGKPLARRLQQEIRDLERRSRLAVDREQRKRELETNRVAWDQELLATEERLLEYRERSRTVRRLIPLREQRDTLARATEKAGDRREWVDLPADLPSTRRDLLQRMDDARTTGLAKTSRCEQLEETIRAFDETDRAWLEEGRAIRRAQRSLGRIADLRRDVTARADDVSDVTAEWNAQLEEYARQAVLPERPRAPELEELFRDPLDLDLLPPRHTLPSPQALNGALVIAGATMIGSAILPFVEPSPGPYSLELRLWLPVGLFVAGLAAAAGLLLLQRSWRRREQQLDQATRRQCLESLRGIADRKKTVELRLDHAKHDLREHEQLIAELGEALDHPIDSESPELGLEQLTERWAAAERREARAESAMEARELTLAEIADARARLQERTDDLAHLDRALRDLGDGDVETGIRRVRERRVAADTADRIEEELREEHASPEEALDELRDAEASGLVATEAELARLEHLHDQEGRERDRLRREIQAAELTLATLSRDEPLFPIATALREKQSELTRARRDRDRALILAGVLREAERTFRESHQEDILRRAGAILGEITGDKYDKLLLAEDGSRLLLFDKNSRQPIPLEEPLSRGLRDQVFFALRLAIADHLDHEHERLPLLIDESLVNWDPERRARGVDLLRSVARERQVFFFTFDPSLHGLAEERTIDLSHAWVR